MKLVRDITGRFIERPHYDPVELDNECETIVCGFLQAICGQVKFPIQTNDLTILIEKYASGLDVYANLTEYGSNVEGVTKFIPKKKPGVLISENISIQPHMENRFRTTLTHELGHVIFHNYLFQMDTKSSLQVCKRDDIVTSVKSSGRDWMEWQAGYACGAFLMPKSFIKKTVDDFNIKLPKTSLNDKKEELIEFISERIKVSKVAARVRLYVLNYLE
jgi:Zn-dependent peptidase ImmA (M78 family)